MFYFSFSHRQNILYLNETQDKVIKFIKVICYSYKIQKGGLPLLLVCFLGRRKSLVC